MPTSCLDPAKINRKICHSNDRPKQETVIYEAHFIFKTLHYEKKGLEIKGALSEVHSLKDTSKLFKQSVQDACKTNIAWVIMQTKAKGRFHQNMSVFLRSFLYLFFIFIISVFFH